MRWRELENGGGNKSERRLTGSGFMDLRETLSPEGGEREVMRGDERHAKVQIISGLGPVRKSNR